MPTTEARSAGVAKFIESLPAEIRERVQKLRDVQSRCDVIKSEFLKETKALEEKYRRLYEPLFKERHDLVVGPEAELHGTQPGAVPGFWLKVLKSADLVGGNVSKRDEPILNYLMDITHAPLEDNKPGFKLVFKFAPNPYFQESVLEKRYYMGGDDETALERTEGTAITWMPDKNPTFKLVKKKTKHGEPTKTKVVQTHSFFDFFSAPIIPETDHGDDLSEIVDILAEDDLEMGCCIKEMLIPSAVAWFTGEIGVEAVLEEADSGVDSSSNEESTDDD